jgi:hypothetical protein
LKMRRGGYKMIRLLGDASPSMLGQSPFIRFHDIVKRVHCNIVTTYGHVSEPHCARMLRMRKDVVKIRE